MAQSDPPAAHPELDAERAHLAAVLAAMGKAVAAPLKSGAGGDQHAAFSLEELRAWRRIQLREALDSPYFARIDFVPEGQAAPQRHYVGKTSFEGDGLTVTGWQAPVAALFYRATGKEASYAAPEGEVRGALQLKRRLVVDHSELLHLADELDERPLRASASRALSRGASADDLLRAVLSEGAAPWLRDIIATIQAPQYALIAAPPDQVLVIQGVAGSGKTSIALHRLSYLIYPALVAGRTPPRCIVFGPNRLFLTYVSAVLPRLGLQHVVQTTLADWALERLGLAPARRTDTTFDALLSPDVPPEEKEARHRRSRLKTSVQMGTLLERYVEWRRAQVQVPEEGWVARQTIQRTTGTLTLENRLPAEELRARHRLRAARPARPFAVHRAQLVESVLTLLTSQYEAAPPPEAEAQIALGNKRLEQARELRAQVARLRSGRPAPAAGAGGGSGGPVFGAAPVFGAPPSFGPRPDRSGAAPAGLAALDAALRQTIRQLELAAGRRQQEGEALIRAGEAARGAVLPPDVAEQARRGARSEAARLVDRYWPPIEPLHDYRALLADPLLLAGLADGLFSPEDVALLTESAPPATRAGGPETIDLSDLPAIHYLFILSQDPEAVGKTSHDYVVVDEAQDVAPLDLVCLRRLERRRCLTLLGDLSQSIYGHRGLTSWQQVEAIFASGPDAAPYTYAECAVGYRTTAEITTLANRVLRSIGAPLEAVPFDRHGPEPALVQVLDDTELVGAVARAVAAEQQRGQASTGSPRRAVAVVTKTVARARELAALFQASGEPALAEVRLVVAADAVYEGGVVLLPVSLAKGLEFDSAIVADAGARTYSASPFDGRLLYVALTRAMHTVHALWTGDLTPHLAP